MFLVSGFMSTQYTEYSVVSKSALRKQTGALLSGVGPIPDYRGLPLGRLLRLQSY